MELLRAITHDLLRTIRRTVLYSSPHSAPHINWPPHLDTKHWRSAMADSPDALCREGPLIHYLELKDARQNLRGAETGPEVQIPIDDRSRVEIPRNCVPLSEPVRPVNRVLTLAQSRHRACPWYHNTGTSSYYPYYPGRTAVGNRSGETGQDYCRRTHHTPGGEPEYA
jgi:hypothetical protein